MRDVNSRLEKLEALTAPSGQTCPACRRPMVKTVILRDENSPEPERCLACGRELPSPTCEIILYGFQDPKKEAPDYDAIGAELARLGEKFQREQQQQEGKQ